VSTSMPLAAVAVLAGVAGLAFGSFASLAAYRLPRGEGVVLGRSRCPHCGHALALADLLPVVSWLALGGRCRYCAGPVPVRYPLIELATAALFVLAVLAWGVTPEALLACALALGLVIAAAADLDRLVIPDPVLVCLLPLGLAWAAVLGRPWSDTIGGLAAALALAAALRWLGARARGREALGLGDVKLLAVAGAWVGLAALPWYLAGAGALGVASGLAWRRRGGEAFPFGPALAAALFATVLWRAPWPGVP